jgi:hypothetical protein
LGAFCFLIWFSISAFWTGDYFIFGIMVTKAVLVTYGVNGADALGYAAVLDVAL